MSESAQLHFGQMTYGIVEYNVLLDTVYIQLCFVVFVFSNQCFDFIYCV